MGWDAALERQVALRTSFFLSWTKPMLACVALGYHVRQTRFGVRTPEDGTPFPSDNPFFYRRRGLLWSSFSSEKEEPVLGQGDPGGTPRVRPA